MQWTDFFFVDKYLRRPGRPPMRQRTLACCAAAVMVCAACAPVHVPPVPTPPPAPPPPAPPTIVYVPMLAPEDAAARQLLAYQAMLSKLPPTEWPKETGKLYESSASLENTMKLAMVLGLTPANGDLGRAQGLLDKVLANPNPEAQAWHGLARLLSALFAEQRRSDEQIEKLNQQLRDTQRDNQRKLDQLNEKLEALKSIERSLNNRMPLPPVSPSHAPSAAPFVSTNPAAARPGPRP